MFSFARQVRFPCKSAKVFGLLHAVTTKITCRDQGHTNIIKVTCLAKQAHKRESSNTTTTCFLAPSLTPMLGANHTFMPQCRTVLVQQWRLDQKTASTEKLCLAIVSDWRTSPVAAKQANAEETKKAKQNKNCQKIVQLIWLNVVT